MKFRVSFVSGCEKPTGFLREKVVRHTIQQVLTSVYHFNRITIEKNHVLFPTLRFMEEQIFRQKDGKAVFRKDEVIYHANTIEYFLFSKDLGRLARFCESKNYYFQLFRNEIIVGKN